MQYTMKYTIFFWRFVRFVRLVELELDEFEFEFDQPIGELDCAKATLLTQRAKK